MDFIAVAAYRDPTRSLKDPTRMNRRFTEGTLRKIRTIFKIGVHLGYECMVLSALGCGAFRNPPKQVAELFEKVIAEFDVTIAKRLSF